MLYTPQGSEPEKEGAINGKSALYGITRRG